MRRRLDGVGGDERSLGYGPYQRPSDGHVIWEGTPTRGRRRRDEQRLEMRHGVPEADNLKPMTGRQVALRSRDEIADRLVGV